MRKILIALFAAGAFLLPPQAAFAAPSPFAGAWEAIDIDGSHMVLTVSRGSSQVRVNLFDEHATSCINRGAVEGSATVVGTGTIDDLTLTWSANQIRCTNGIVIDTSEGTNTFTYVPASDTLTVDPELWGGAVTWSRVGG